MTQGGGGPKFGKTWWRNTWMLPYLLISGYEMIWNGDQCPHISNHDQVKTKEACKSICRRNYHCTAVSYSKMYNACVLRACGSQVPEPKWKHANYRGFVVKDIGMDKGIWYGKCGWAEPYLAFWGPYAKKSFEAPAIG